MHIFLVRVNRRARHIKSLWSNRHNLIYEQFTVRFLIAPMFCITIHLQLQVCVDAEYPKIES
jgi:hypothetical protein